MVQNKVFLMLFVACWSCSMTVFGVAAPKGPLQSHITGGYKGKFIFSYSIELYLICILQAFKCEIAGRIWIAINLTVIMTFSITFPSRL